MRIVFIGAADLTVMTARQLAGDHHEVVVIEKDKSRIDELCADLDAGFIHGDGSKPAILREADPAATDFLFCLTDNDQYNIIASLVGRSLGFKRVVTRIEDPAYEHICIELGLEDTIVPNFTIARFLADMCAGESPLEVTALVKGDARVFSFIAAQEDEGPVADLNLPGGASLMFFYHDEKLMFPKPDALLREGDEVVVIAHRKAMPDLLARGKRGERDSG